MARPKKDAVAVQVLEKPVEEIAVKPEFDPSTMREKPEPTAEERERTLPEIIRESRKLVGVPVEPGMKLFEAPNGYVQLGEAGSDRVWCRHAEGGPGKPPGGWINPMRGAR